MHARVLSFVRSPSNTYGTSDDCMTASHLSSPSMSKQSLVIHTRAVSRAKTYLKAEVDLIDSLREVEDDRTYRHFKQTSIYEYAMKTMKLSENVALTLIAIMRKSRRIPELTEAIRSGRVTTSKAKKIISVINEQNKSAWIELAATKTSKQIEKAVVTQNPLAATQESLRFKTADRLELTLGVSEDWAARLARVKDVASQKLKRAVSTEEALLLAMDGYLEANDPIEKANRAKVRRLKDSTAKPQELDTAQTFCIVENSETESSQKEKVETPMADLPKNSPFSRTVTPIRKSLPAKLKHDVMLRDQSRCMEHDHEGNRCENRRWLDVHHVIPLSEGGRDELDNLRTFCSEHHRIEHRQTK